MDQCLYHAHQLLLTISPLEGYKWETEETLDYSTSFSQRSITWQAALSLHPTLEGQSNQGKVIRSGLSQYADLSIEGIEKRDGKKGTEIKEKGDLKSDCY